MNLLLEETLTKVPLADIYGNPGPTVAAIFNQLWATMPVGSLVADSVGRLCTLLKRPDLYEWLPPAAQREIDLLSVMYDAARAHKQIGMR